MPKVSINILTKNRAEALVQALNSVAKQTFTDFELVVVDDGSTDSTDREIANCQLQTTNKFQIINHEISKGITASRQEALAQSKGDYIAILDDDDLWLDSDKLKKQVEFLNSHPDCVLVGGGIIIEKNKTKLRPETDRQIRNWILLKNPFFTSTVMFRRHDAIKAGGFVKDEIDLAEDYDLWLRLGELGKLYNFQEIFTLYSTSQYSPEKFKSFLKKQLYLIEKHRQSYPFYLLARAFLTLRILL